MGNYMKIGTNFPYSNCINVDPQNGGYFEVPGQKVDIKKYYCPLTSLSRAIVLFHIHFLPWHRPSRMNVESPTPIGSSSIKFVCGDCLRVFDITALKFPSKWRIVDVSFLMKAVLSNY